MKNVIYIPGVHEDNEKGLMNSLSSLHDFKVFLFSPWGSVEELKEIDLRIVHNRLRQKIKMIGKGEKVYLAGRSFGGGVALSFESDEVEAKILFAPAIRFSDEDEFRKDVRFKDIETFFENTISKSFIESQEIPILILHDPEDKKVPFSNSEMMSKECSNVELIKSDSGHGFIGDNRIIDSVEEWLNRGDAPWQSKLTLSRFNAYRSLRGLCFTKTHKV